MGNIHQYSIANWNKLPEGSVGKVLMACAFSGQRMGAGYSNHWDWYGFGAQPLFTPLGVEHIIDDVMFYLEDCVVSAYIQYIHINIIYIYIICIYIYIHIDMIHTYIYAYIYIIHIFACLCCHLHTNLYFSWLCSCYAYSTKRGVSRSGERDGAGLWAQGKCDPSLRNKPSGHHTWFAGNSRIYIVYYIWYIGCMYIM